MPKMTNPLNERQFERLRKSIDWSNRMLEVPRDNRNIALRQFVGFHYNVDAAPKKVYAPFLKMAVTIYIRSLAARAPQVLISTKDPNLKSTAVLLELAVNEIPSEIGLQGTFRRTVLEALFSIGVVKCGLHTVGEVLGHKYGAPFVDVITFDDYVLDMSASNKDQIQYEGNSYWMNYADVMEDDFFDKKKKQGLEPDNYTVLGERGESRGEGLSQDEDADLYKKKVQLRDIWLPEEDLLITYGVHSKKIFNVTEWEGPNRGPYHKLFFDEVPSNLLPIPPVMIWQDIHELANSLYRKLGKQAKDQKTVQGFTGNDEDAVLAFKNENDGGAIRWQGGKPELLTAGGVNPNTLAFFLQTKDFFSWIAGNLDSLGGLSPQAETLGQEKLISGSSSAQLRDMADQVVDFSQELFRTLAYYEWHDPVRNRVLQMKIPGMDLAVPVPWDQQSRKGGFDVYDLNIAPHSMSDDSPSQKLQKLGVIMQQYIMPLMPAIEAQNGELDVQFLMDILAKHSPFPELNRLIIFPNEQPNEMNADRQRKPANTSRTVERVNRPGATESGKSAALQQTLLGGKQQPAEAAAIGRPTG